MKRFLSSLLLTSSTVMMFGQVVFTENFETLTNGNVGTDVTGATAGQNSWYTLYGANSDYQIGTVDATHGKSLTVASYSSYDATANSTLNTRIAAKLTTATATTANNILQVKFDFYTGLSTGAGTVQMRVWGMDGTVSRTLGGFAYNYATKVLTGLATANNLVPPNPPTTTTPLGPTTYSFNLIAAPGLTLTANTWYTLIYEYNKTTGVSTWRYPTGSGSTSTTSTSYSLIPGMVAQDYYFYNITSTGNTVSNQVSFDNITAQFGTSATLSTNEVDNIAGVKNSITLYPNPASDVVNIKTDSKINTISVVDLTGRKLDVKLDGDKVDVKKLPAGTYLMNIETKDGIFTEKFIKK